jgi:hypothetical protein
VLDNLERAIELADKENDTLKPMIEGVELTLKSMQSGVASLAWWRWTRPTSRSTPMPTRP